MTDLLTLEDARKAIGLPPNDGSQDADLLSTYIPAVTPIVEDLTGPIVPRTGVTWVVDGGNSSIVLPTRNISAVTAVTENGTVLTAGVDYTVNIPAGIIVRSPSLQWQMRFFRAGRQNIVVTYNTLAEVPANVRLAGRIILRHLWQSDQQGYRPNFGVPDNDTVTTPSGMGIPKRAWELLQANKSLPGFA